jgi:hypothetical protein
MAGKRTLTLLAVFTTCTSAFVMGENLGLSFLPSIAQSKISGTLGRNDQRYRARVTLGRLQSENPAHRLSAIYERDGVRLRSGSLECKMGLSRYGHGDQLHAVEPTDPQPLLNRVEYRRGTLTEWYVNGPAGLEQGFTVSRRPPAYGGNLLSLELSLTGSGFIAGANPKSFDIVDARGNSRLSYGGLTAIDADGKELPAHLVLRQDAVLLQVDDAQAHYPVTIDPVITQAELIPSDGQQFSSFGVSVAVSGNTVVVGSPGYADQMGNIAPGYAYVYIKPTTGWANMLQIAELSASDTGDDPGNFFGFGVAIDGAADTIVVGCEGLSQAYVYEKPAGGWTNMTETAILSAGSTLATFGFGFDVGIDSSADTIVVGSVYAQFNGGFPEGAAYVFLKPESGWKSVSTANAMLSSSDIGSNDRLGSSIAVSEDTIVLGADGHPAPDAFGSVYVYVKPATGWTSMTQTAELKASMPLENAELGSSVAMLGNTIVSGAPGGSNSQPAGNVFVFVEPARGWSNMTETARLTDGNTVEDSLGWSVAMTGNAILAGAPTDTVGGNVEQGSAYVFLEPKGGWKSTSKSSLRLTSEYGQDLDVMGVSVAATGSTAFVGAPGVPAGGDVGSAYVFF